MKFNYLLTLLVFPTLVSAHDGSLHTETWYQFIVWPALVPIIAVAIVVIGIGYRYKFAFPLTYSAGVMVVLVGVAGMHYLAYKTDPVAIEVANQLSGVQMTLYRTPSCGCCSVYAEELKRAGALVTTETINPQEMQELKETHGISREQASCHTTLVNGYVVEGHVPFSAVAQLLSEQPVSAGITLPGMPIGTPGMPGRQVETYKVETLEGELFWQS